MRKIASEAKLCKICMEQHDVDVVEVMDEEIFKGEEVVFKATYEYCPNADEYLETEEMVKRNSLAMKDAYRQRLDTIIAEVGGLNASQIVEKMHNEEAYKSTPGNSVISFDMAKITSFQLTSSSL